MNILIVCTGNTCRSPMAAGLLRTIAQSKGQTVDVRSAGLAHHEGKRVAENAVKVMAELGIDISTEYSKPVTLDTLNWADVVVTVQRSHADHLAEEHPELAYKTHSLEKDVPDPYCGPLTKYRDARDVLKILLARFIDSIQTGMPHS